MKTASKSTNKSDTRGLFFVLTLTITIAVYGILYYIYGTELTDSLFYYDKDQFVPFLLFRFGKSAGMLGLLAASALPQLIYNIYICVDDNLKFYQYIISVFIAIVGACAYIALIYLTTIIVYVGLTIGGLILLIIIFELS